MFWGLSIIESLEDVSADTESRVMSVELNILGAIFCHETDFKNIGGTRDVLVISDEVFVLALLEVVWSEFWLLVEVNFVVIEHEFGPEVDWILFVEVMGSFEVEFCFE